MAFNPFQRFRKHQKLLMALLVLLCMFIFVFTGFSRGDLMDWLSRKFGWKQQGQLVVTLYGEKVGTEDLKQEAHRRLLASEFLIRAALQGLRLRLFGVRRIRSKRKAMASLSPALAIAS